MGHALVLNASFEPLHIVPWQRAIQLLFQGKVEVVEESEREIRTVRLTIRAPSVLRLLRYAPMHKHRQLVRFSRTNIFLRDEHRCQYCNDRFARSHLTLDHVVPIVQGGKTHWENIVTACKPCNQRKGGRTPAQARLSLVRSPRQPRSFPFLGLLPAAGSPAPVRWRIYLGLEPPADDEG